MVPSLNARVEGNNAPANESKNSTNPMAHNLNINNGRASIALATQSAWHRLGQILPDAFDAATALREANMDWEVRLEPMFLGNGTEVPNKKAVVRGDNGTVIGTVGSRYNPLQNKSAFGFFDGVFGQDKARYESAGVLGGGERVWMLARVPGDFDVLPGDSVAKYLLLTNSHDGSTPVTAIFTPIRVVCANTLGSALRASNDSETVRVLHTASAEAKLKIAGELLGKAGVFFDETKARFVTMSKVQFRSNDLRRYFTNVVTNDPTATFDDISTRSRNVIGEIEKLHETGIGHEIRGVRGTLWGAYNAVTEYVDHSKSNDSLEYMARGGGARMKARAFEIANEFALASN